MCHTAIKQSKLRHTNSQEEAKISQQHTILVESPKVNLLNEEYVSSLWNKVLYCHTVWIYPAVYYCGYFIIQDQILRWQHLENISLVSYICFLHLTIQRTKQIQGDWDILSIVITLCHFIDYEVYVLYITEYKFNLVLKFWTKFRVSQKCLMVFEME